MINRVTLDHGSDFLSPLTISGDIFFLLLGDLFYAKSLYSVIKDQVNNGMYLFS